MLSKRLHTRGMLLFECDECHKRFLHMTSLCEHLKICRRQQTTEALTKSCVVLLGSKGATSHETTAATPVLSTAITSNEACAPPKSEFTAAAHSSGSGGFPEPPVIPLSFEGLLEPGTYNLKQEKTPHRQTFCNGSALSSLVLNMPRQTPFTKLSETVALTVVTSEPRVILHRLGGKIKKSPQQLSSQEKLVLEPTIQFVKCKEPKVDFDGSKYGRRVVANEDFTVRTPKSEFEDVHISCKTEKDFAEELLIQLDLLSKGKAQLIKSEKLDDERIVAENARKLELRLTKRTIETIHGRQCGGHKCDICEKMLSTAKILRKHKNDVHKRSELRLTKQTIAGRQCGGYKCDICEKMFSTAKILRRHKNGVHCEKCSDGHICCPECNVAFSTKSLWEIHYYAEHGEKLDQFGLTTDSGEMSFDASLYDSIEGEGKPTYRCLVCGKVLRHAGEVMQHLTSHRRRFAALAEPGLTLLTCSYCGKSFINFSLLKFHLRTHTGEKPFNCAQCSKQFAIKFQLDRHLRIHEAMKDPKRAYPCNECQSHFNEFSGLKEHMKRVHLKDKNAECDICGLKLFAKSNLRVHMSVHTNEKPFACQTCDKKFRLQLQLEKHKRVHTGVKPYSCDKCDRKFANRSNMMLHKRIHDGVKPYKCSACNKRFANHSNMVVHLKSHRRK